MGQRYQQQLLSNTSGTLERASEDGRILKMAYAAAGLELDHCRRINRRCSRHHDADRFLLAGVALSVLFAALFVIIIVMLTRPLA